MGKAKRRPAQPVFQVSHKAIEILRKRQTEIEDRLDRSWMPEPDQSVLGGGPVHYEVAERMRGIECEGLGLIQQLVRKLKLAEAIDDRVRVLRRHLPYQESDHVLNLIYNVMTGGSCLQDVEARRQDVGYLEALGAHKIPAPSTEGDFLRHFEGGDVEDLMEAFNEVRLKVWKAQKKSFRREATIDADATIAPTQGN